MLEPLPEPGRTPSVARAVISPSALLLAGAGTFVALLAGLPIAGAAAIGAASWGARVSLALSRRRRDPIRPSNLRDPWRTLVRRAVRAQERFEQAVKDTDPGPLRDRLADVGRQVEEATRQCWRIARRGDALDRAVKELDMAGANAQLAGLERDRARWRDHRELQATAEALRRRVESGRRLQAVAEQARDRLRRLDAQLDEAVARAIELSLGSLDAGAIQPLGTDIDALVSELESLRQALDETGRSGEAPAG